MEDEHSIVVLYHGQCPDGFGAAFSFWKKFGNKAKYIPVSHGQQPPVEAFYNDHLFIIDFAYNKTITADLSLNNKNFTLLDHHISAKNELDGTPGCLFDMTHSGSALAWRYCFGEELPKIIKYIEARDLWQWGLPDEEEILSAIDSYPQDFVTWDMLQILLETPDGYQQLKQEGAAIQRYKDYLMERIKVNKTTMEIDGTTVSVLNTPFFQSELVAELAQNQPFAAAYYFDGRREEYIFSLRSSESGEDVSKIAKKYGGGGHKNSAGFQLKNLSDLKL